MNTNIFREFARLMNQIGMVLAGIAALSLLTYTIACAFGLLPWLNLTVSFGDTTFTDAGQIAQIALTVFMIMLASFIPAASRVSLLENSHRKFHLKMEDVAQAYYRCHAADKSGVFELSSEFDAVRERLTYMRDHPELGSLEPDVLEVAAQMSQVSQEIASVYSDENIGRAKLFLRQRQEEVSSQKMQVSAARKVYQEIEQWSEQLNAEAHMSLNDQAELDAKLRATLREFGLSVVETGDNIHSIATRTAAE